MDDKEECFLSLPVEVGVIVRGFQEYDEDVETMWHISEAFKQTSADYKVCNMIYPVGTNKDCAVVQFSYGVQKLIDIGTLKIEGKTELRIEQIKIFAIGKKFSIRVDPVVACLLPNLATIHCEKGVEYVGKYEEHCFVFDSNDGLQMLIDSIIVELRKTLLGREHRGQLSSTTLSNSSEDHSDSESSCGSFVLVDKEDVKDFSNFNIVACCVVITSIHSKICNWKDKVFKFLQNLKCENATIVYIAEDHAIAVFNDEKDADRLLTKASQLQKSPVRCSRLSVPRVMDGGKLIRVQPTVSAIFPDIVKHFKQRWKAVMILNCVEFIIDFNHLNILPELMKYVSINVIENYSSCPQSTSQMIDRKSVQISTNLDENSGTKLSHGDKKESVNIWKDELPINKSAEEIESTIEEQCKQHGDDENDKKPNQYEPIQAKSSKICNSQGKKRKSTVTEVEAQIQEEDSIENCDDSSSKSGIIKRPKKVDAPQNLPNCNIAEGNQVDVQDYATRKEQARDMDQMNDKCCHISESEDVTGRIEDTQGQHGDQNIDTKGKSQQDSQDHHTIQSDIDKENRDDQDQQAGQNKDTKGKRQNDSQVHHTRQSEIEKDNRDDQGQQAGQNKDTKGKRQNDSQNHHTMSQSEIEKQNRDDQGQQAGQNKDTKGKRQNDSQDHHTSQSEIEKDNRDDQGQQAGQNKDTKGKRQKDSQDHHTSQSEIEKDNRDDQGQQAGQNKDTKGKRQSDSQDHHTMSQSEIEKQNRDDQGQQAGQNKDTKGKRQNDSQDHHTSQCEIEKDNRDDQGQQAGQNKDTKCKRQNDSQDHHTSQSEIEKENRDDQGQQAGQNKDTKGKRQNDSQDHHTSQSEIEKENRDYQGQQAGQNKDTKGKRQNDSQVHHTSQSEIEKDNRDDQGQQAGQNKDTKCKRQNDSQVHHTRQSEIEKDNRDDQGQQAGQNKDTKGKRQSDSQDHHTSQSEIEKQNRDDQGQQAGQNKDTKGKRQNDSQDHHTSQCEIEKDNRDDQGQQAGQNKDTKCKKQSDSQDHHISESEKQNRDDQGQQAGQNKDAKGKRQNYSQDHHTSQSEIQKENINDQGQQTGQNIYTKGKRQNNCQDHHTSQREIEKEESRDDEVKHAGQNTKGKSQRDSHDHHTSQDEIEKENRDGQGQQAGPNKDTKGKRQNDSQDHHTSQSELQKENIDDQGQQAGQNKDTKGKRQKDSQDHRTSQSEIEKENKRDNQGHHVGYTSKGKQVWDQAQFTCQGVDTTGGDYTSQSKSNTDKRQEYGQVKHTGQEVDTTGRDYTSQGKSNTDKRQEYGQVKHTCQEVDTTGRDYTSQGKSNTDKRQEYGQVKHTCQEVDPGRDYTGQSKSNTGKRQEYGQFKHTGREVDTTGGDYTSQGKSNTDKRQEYGQVKHTGQEVDTTGRDYTSQGKSNTHKRQEYGQTHDNPEEDNNYRGQWNDQDQQTIQKKIDDREEQGNGQHQRTSHDDDARRVQAQNVIQGHTMHQRDCAEGRNKRQDKVKTTAEKKDEVKQSQLDMRTGYLTVHNEVYQFLKQYQEKKLKKIERNYDVNIKWMKNETERNLVVLSNNYKDEEERRKIAENEFIQLYQDVSNNVKLQNFPVEYHKSYDIERSLKGTMQESQNVLLLHKDKNVLFIGDENNVTQAKKFFKRLLGIPVEEKRLRKPVKETEKSSGSTSTITVGRDIKVIVGQADITSEDVDVIVNAANSGLQHDGGVAKAIAVKAGRAMDFEGQRKLKERRSGLNVSEVLHTGGYKLNAKYVLHAVGPMQHRGHAAGPKHEKHDQFYCLLKDTFLNCLEYADEKLKAKSIAIPLISSGNFGGGKRECAKALATSVNDFAQINKFRNLKEIRLVNIDAEATQEIQTEIDAIVEYIPSSQNSAVSGNIDERLLTHPVIEEIELSHAVLVEGFKIYQLQEKTKLNLVMFLSECTNGGGEVEHVIYPVEKLPKKAVVIFSEQEVAKMLISLGKSTTNGQNLQFKSIEVGHHWEAIILDISAIYPSNLLNGMPARCEDLGDGRLLLESKESAHEVETEVNNELEKWLNSQVDGVDIKEKFSESQCVIVTGFEEHKIQETTRDKLEIILTKQKNGGGDIEQIVYPFGNSKSKALAIFTEPKVAKSLIKAKKMSDGKGQSLEIHPLEKLSLQKTLGTSQCVIVTGFKEFSSQEKTRDALQITLQIKKKGGGDVEKILYPFGKSTNTAVAIFSKTEVANSLTKAKTISDGKGQNLKIYPFKVGHQMKTFIFVFNEAVVQLEPTLKDDILRILDMKGEYLEDGGKLMLEEEDDLNKVYKHVTGRIQILLNSCIQEKSNQPGSIKSHQVDRRDFLLYQFFKKCHKDKVKEIERAYDVTIRWMPDKNELAVQSNKPGDDTDRKNAEGRFEGLYQKVHPIIKQLQVEDVHLFEAQKAENKITRKHADVLILPKEYVFIGSEDNVEQAMKDFKMLCEVSTFEESLQHDGGLLLTDVEYTIGRLKVIIRLGDITNEDVDVIVNAANGELQHGSGVAKAIAMKAGRGIHDEGQRLLKQRRRALNVSQVLRTDGHNLKAKYVLHAVGPRYGKDNPFQTLLKNTFLNCLESADGVEATSIAIPLISSGVFGGKKEECAQLLYDSILNFVQSEECQNLKEIRLVNIDLEATTAIQDVFKTYSGRSWGNAHSMQTSVATSTLSRDETYCQHFHSSQTEKNESINSSQTSIHQNTRSKGQMPRIGDASKFEDSSYDEQNKRNIKQEQSSNSAWQATTNTNTAATRAAGSVAKEEEEKCPICFDKLTETMKQLACGHKFCRDCIEKALSMKPVCPVCGKMFGALTGNQPRGFMKTAFSSWSSLPGYKGCGYIEITYDIPPGTQTHEHPHPGKPYYGTQRTAYLPDNRDGRYVASLLRKAFDARLIFTIGTSVTTGASDCVTWNDIHHKTSMTGGPNNYGYPDSNYLRRVREELAAKGIK